VAEDAVAGVRVDDVARRGGQIEARDTRAGAGKRSDVLPPETARAAGNDRAFACEIEELLGDGAV
jgi:hypothetical protein